MMKVMKKKTQLKISLKSIVKMFIPDFVFTLKENYVLSQLYKHDRLKFAKYYGKNENWKQDNIDAKLVFYAHALEKGLSHLEFRGGFGEHALKQLKKYLTIYNEYNYSKESLAYKNALSCLKAYKLKHLEVGIPLPTFYNEIFDEILEEIEGSDEQLGGVLVLKKSSKNDNRTINFEKLFNNRVSIREYSVDPVNKNQIEEAIDIAMKSPSVCNRQSARVRVINNIDLISKTLMIQGGYNGYELPPSLILITTNTKAFIQNNERNQIYIDGGLFAMSLLLALEYVGLAACSLNSMFGLKQEKLIREVLDIPDNENFIMFISVGNFLDETPYPKSFRYSGKDVTKFID